MNATTSPSQLLCAALWSGDVALVQWVCDEFGDLSINAPLSSLEEAERCSGEQWELQSSSGKRRRRGNIGGVRVLVQEQEEHYGGEYLKSEVSELMLHPLHIAAARGHDAVVAELVRRGANVHGRDKSNRFGWTPLHWACLGLHLECVRTLLDCGANYLSVARDGVTTPKTLLSYSMALLLWSTRDHHLITPWYLEQCVSSDSPSDVLASPPYAVARDGEANAMAPLELHQGTCSAAKSSPRPIVGASVADGTATRSVASSRSPRAKSHTPPRRVSTTWSHAHARQAVSASARSILSASPPPPQSPLSPALASPTSPLGPLGNGSIRSRRQPLKDLVYNAERKHLPYPSLLAYSATRTPATVLLSWGQGSNYGLGHGRTTSRAHPRAVNLGTDAENDAISACAASQFHSAAVTSSGRLYTWGVGSSGALGQGNKRTFAVPTLVQLSKSVACVATGPHHTVFATRSGSVFAMGLAARGRLGVIMDGSHAVSPVRVPVEAHVRGASVCGVACGTYHSLAVCTSGRVLSWGGGDLGQTGLSHTKDKNEPTEIGTVRNCKEVHAYEHHSLLLLRSGELIWFGDGCSIPFPVPLQTRSLAKRIIAQRPLFLDHALCGIDAPSDRITAVACGSRFAAVVAGVLVHWKGVVPEGDAITPYIVQQKFEARVVSRYCSVQFGDEMLVCTTDDGSIVRFDETALDACSLPLAEWDPMASLPRSTREPTFHDLPYPCSAILLAVSAKHCLAVATGDVRLSVSQPHVWDVRGLLTQAFDDQHFPDVMVVGKCSNGVKFSHGCHSSILRLHCPMLQTQLAGAELDPDEPLEVMFPPALSGLLSVDELRLYLRFVYMRALYFEDDVPHEDALLSMKRLVSMDLKDTAFRSHVSALLSASPARVLRESDLAALPQFSLLKLEDDELGESTDVELVCADGTVLKFYRFLLIAASPYFLASLASCWRESLTRCINLQEVSSAAMRCVLHFIVSGSVGDVHPNIMVEALLAAYMFDLQAMVGALECKLVEVIDLVNVHDLLELAEVYSLHTQRYACLRMLLAGLPAYLDDTKSLPFDPARIPLLQSFTEVLLKSFGLAHAQHHGLSDMGFGDEGDGDDMFELDLDGGSSDAERPFPPRANIGIALECIYPSDKSGFFLERLLSRMTEKQLTEKQQSLSTDPPGSPTQAPRDGGPRHTEGDAVEAREQDDGCGEEDARTKDGEEADVRAIVHDSDHAQGAAETGAGESSKPSSRRKKRRRARSRARLPVTSDGASLSLGCQATQSSAQPARPGGNAKGGRKDAVWEKPIMATGLASLRSILEEEEEEHAVAKDAREDKKSAMRKRGNGKRTVVKLAQRKERKAERVGWGRGEVASAAGPSLRDIQAEQLRSCGRTGQTKRSPGVSRHSAQSNARLAKPAPKPAQLRDIIGEEEKRRRIAAPPRKLSHIMAEEEIRQIRRLYLESAGVDIGEDLGTVMRRLRAMFEGESDEEIIRQVKGFITT